MVAGQRPYVCQICGRAFTQHAHLRYHLRVHAAERPFPCDTCGASFRCAAARRKHQCHVHVGGGQQRLSPGGVSGDVTGEDTLKRTALTGTHFFLCPCVVRQLCPGSVFTRHTPCHGRERKSRFVPGQILICTGSLAFSRRENGWLFQSLGCAT